MYRTAQQQSNDIFTFAMSLLFMGFMFSLVKSLAADENESEKVTTKLLPRTLKGTADNRVVFKSVNSRNEGEPVPSRYRELVSWLDEPLFGYKSGLDLLPAVDTVTGEPKIDSVLKQLKEGVEGIQQSDNFRQFLLTMSKFHDYSIGNLILIMLQKPDATHVAGFTTWKNLGRWVQKGARGIAILAPCMPPKNKKPEIAVKPDTTEQSGEESEQIEETRPVFFKVVYVFDLSQTEGKSLPEFEIPVLTGEANEALFEQVLRLAKLQGLEVSFEPKPEQDPAIKGMYYSKNIWIKPDESRAQQLKTLLHEMAHHYSEGVFRMPRRDAETIAESVAFTIGAHFGFDTGTRSFPYVALWSKDKKVLEANLASIRKVSAEVIASLDQIQNKAIGVA